MASDRSAQKGDSQRYKDELESTIRDGLKFTSNSTNLTDSKSKVPPRKKVIREDIELELEDQYVSSLKQLLTKDGKSL